MLRNFPLYFQWLFLPRGGSAQHTCNMADKIDPAIAQLARENPSHIYRDGDTGVVVTSTCTDGAPARWPLVSKQSDITESIHTSIYNQCIESTALPRKNVVSDAAKLYGRCVRTIETILSTFTRST
jgi:hypothetical protein